MFHRSKSIASQPEKSEEKVRSYLSFLGLFSRKQVKFVITREKTTKSCDIKKRASKARGSEENTEEGIQKGEQDEKRANKLRKKQSSTPHISASKHKKKDSNELQKEKKFLPLQANEPPTSQKTHRSFLFTLKF